MAKPMRTELDLSADQIPLSEEVNRTLPKRIRLELSAFGAFVTIWIWGSFFDFNSAQVFFMSVEIIWLAMICGDIERLAAKIETFWKRF